MRLLTLFATFTSLFSSLVGLTQEQYERYQRDGYLVIENFVSEENCDQLKQRALEIVSEQGPNAALEMFSTTKQGRPSDKFFLDSAVGTVLFFEPKAFDQTGRLQVDLLRAINKIGHGMHDTDPVFNEFSRLPQIKQLVTDLGIHNPLLMQAMYIFKQPRIGGEVTCHQDGTFLYAEPDTMIGLWFAIEDATLENGCLWVIPGGHVAPLKSRFKKSLEGGTYFEVYDTTPWDLSKRIPLEVKKGGLVILHSRVPHMSECNLSDKSRHAYTIHLIDATSDYPADNWLQRPENMPARGF